MGIGGKKGNWGRMSRFVFVWMKRERGRVFWVFDDYDDDAENGDENGERKGEDG